MITIKINEDERQLNQIDEQWITQQINRRRESGEVVCVRVTILQGELNLALATPTCQNPRGSGGRPPNQQEREIFDLWNKQGLDNFTFTGGNLIAFLKHLKSYY